MSLTPSVPKTDRRPEYIRIFSGDGRDLYICWECAYGECEHCDSYNECEHTHWWTNAYVSKTQSITVRNASSGVRSDSEQSAQPDLFASTGDGSQVA